MRTHLLAVFFFCGLFGIQRGWSFGNTLAPPEQYGPNLGFRLLGDTPLGWGAWVPTGQARLDFNWYEPLASSSYGTALGDGARYLRLQGAVALSPYYAELQTALGVAPVATNPRFDIRLVYRNLVYLGSNVEMAMADRAEEKEISKTWSADYIYDQFYDESSFAQIQSFGFWIDVEYVLAALRLQGSTRYTLLDVRTDYDGKSYDYSRNLPVFSRDFVLEGEMNAALTLGDHLNLLGDLYYCSTGALRDAGGEYSKVPLSYWQALLGPQWIWNRSHSFLSSQAGFRQRLQDDSFAGSWNEHLLVKIEYATYWDFFFAH